MACRAAGWGSLARFAVDCKLSVLRHVSRDTSWDTVVCWVPQQWWTTISLSAVDYRPMSTVLNALQEKDRSDHEVLTGLVERVTYQNAENGFCVVRIKARGHRELVTLVG